MHDKGSGDKLFVVTELKTYVLGGCVVGKIRLSTVEQGKNSSTTSVVKGLV